MSICIIPAKGNSRRIPEKNIKDFHGKPIIAYSIETALKSGLFDQVFVSTDSEKLASIAMKYKARPFFRSEEYLSEDTGTNAVVREFLRYSDIFPEEIVCCLYPCAPFVRKEDLEDAIELVKEEDEFVFGGLFNGDDVGQFYVGRAKDFMSDRDFTDWIDMDERGIDINTPEDWELAEKLYEELNK